MPTRRRFIRKLSLVVMLASSVALLSASAAFMAYDYVTFRQGMVYRLSKDAEIVGFHSVSALMFEDHEAATKTLAGLKAESDVLEAAIYDRQGRLFASYRRSAAGLPQDFPERAVPAGYQFGNDGLVLSRSIDFEGKRIGSVFIRASLAELESRLSNFAGILVLVCLGSLLIALAISSHFQKAISRPILHLAETARIVSRDKDYSTRATQQGDGELGLLIHTFNEMLSQIQQRDRALLESQQRFDRAVGGTADGLWDWDIRSGQVWYAPRFAALLGYEESEFGSSLDTLKSHLHPDDLDRTLEAIRLHLEHNALFDIEFRLRTKAGDFRWFRARAEAVGSPDGRKLRMAGSIQDVTERRATQEALARSERYFRELADAMPQIVWAAGPDGRADYFNKRWFEYTGLTAENPVGIDWRAVLHPDDVEPSLERWTLPSSTGNDYSVEYRLRRHADGVYRWHLGRAVAVRDSRGLIVRWFGTWTDIDDQKRTEEVLEGQAKELSRSNAELEQFAYAASHDLQEPLRAVAGCVQLLQRRYGEKLDERADELIRHSVEAATRMQTLITDLLSFSRVGTRGKIFATTDCSAILARALANLRVSIEETGAHVTWDELPTVAADATQITQLFQNLIGNAIKFRRDEVPRVHVGAERRGSEWLFSVRDNGIGIDPVYSERVFGVFQRLHTRVWYPGTGIGLAICKKIVERHGGTIRFESALDRGTTFYFTIPTNPSGGVRHHEHEARLQTH